LKRANEKGLFNNGKILYIRISDISPNPQQPRKIFDPDALKELSESIRLYGVLQPLTVRKVGGQYELVAGERRLRAAQLAGFEEVPCILLTADNRQSSLVSLVENLQRKNLDFIEEAEGISQLIHKHGLSQEQAAFYLGKSQSAVANKLRILRHPPEVLAVIRDNRLTERHARALLCIEDLGLRKEAALFIVKKELNVAQTEQYISQLLQEKNKPLSANIRNLFVIKDVRFFLNTLDRALSMMKKSGVSAKYDRQDTEDAILLTIRIPRHGQVRGSHHTIRRTGTA